MKNNDRRPATTNRPFRLSSRTMRGLDGNGAIVAKGEVVTILEVLPWSSALAMVRTAAGDEGMVKREWLEEVR